MDAQVVYIASNAYWEEMEVLLPALPRHMAWELAVDTWQQRQAPRRLAGDTFMVKPRSVMVFVAVRATA